MSIALDNTVFKNIRVRYFIFWIIILQASLWIPFSLIGKMFPSVNLDDPLFSLIHKSIIYFILFFLILKKLKINKNNLYNLMGNWSGSKSLLNLLIIIPLIIFSIGSILLLFYYLSFLMPEVIKKLLNNKLFFDTTKTSFPVVYNVLNSLTLALIAPVVEELFFRGIVVNRWSIKWNLSKALIFSSIFFAIAHNDLFGALSFSLIAGLFYLNARSLWLPVILHILNNFFVLITSIVSIFGKNNSPIDTIGKQDLKTGSIMVLASLPFIIWYLKKYWPKNLASNPQG